MLIYYCSPSVAGRVQALLLGGGAPCSRCPRSSPPKTSKLSALFCWCGVMHHQRDRLFDTSEDHGPWAWGLARRSSARRRARAWRGGWARPLPASLPTPLLAKPTLVWNTPPGEFGGLLVSPRETNKRSHDGAIPSPGPHRQSTSRHCSSNPKIKKTRQSFRPSCQCIVCWMCQATENCSRFACRSPCTAARCARHRIGLPVRQSQSSTGVSSKRGVMRKEIDFWHPCVQPSTPKKHQTDFEFPV